MEENTQPSVEAKKSSMMPLMIGVVVLLLIAGGAYVLSQNSSKGSGPSVTIQPTAAVIEEANESPTTQEDEPETTGAMEESGSVKTFTVTGSSFAFDPEEIRVKKGDKVKITFINSGGVHDFVIDELNVATKQLASGQSETIEFVADKVGTFEYYCSVGNHREMGMEGDLIVE